jgi:hypothetical protein
MWKIIENHCNRLQKKAIIQNKGLPIFYVVYKPQNDGKNVFFNYIHPDIRENPKLNWYLKRIGKMVRDFYEERPELLEEILKSVKE